MPATRVTDLREFSRLMQDVRGRVSARRFWTIVIIGCSIGLVIALPFVFLLSRDQIGIAGFMLDCFWGFVMPALLFVAFASVIFRIVKEDPETRVRAFTKNLPVFVFPLISFFVLRVYSSNVRFHLALHRVDVVTSVRIGCKEINQREILSRVSAAIRAAQWFSPMSHGWSHDIPFTLKLQSGRELHYFLSRYESNEAAVIVSPDANPGRAASRELASILTEAGAWHAIPRWSDYTHSYQNEMIAETECADPNRR